MTRLTSYIILLLLLMSSCEKVDLRGMFMAYESVNSRFSDSMRWNEAHPPRAIVVEEDAYTLFVMGDSHVGGTDNLDIFFGDALAAGAEAALMAGDLVTGRRKAYERFERHLPDPDAIALFPVAGNHDLYFNGWEEYYARLGSSTYLFTVQTPEAADLYICLDSGSGTLGSKQLDWLRETLENKRQDYRHCIVMTHNNFFRFRRTASTNPLVEELHVLMDMFTRHNVNMLITGHDHRRSDEVFGLTRYVTLDALLDGFSHASYMVLSVENGEIGVEFVSF